MNAATHPIRAYRARRELTLEGLAAELGVKKSTIWRWERGRMPRAKDWQRITAKTGIEPSDLIPFVKTGAAE